MTQYIYQFELSEPLLSKIKSRPPKYPLLWVSWEVSFINVRLGTSTGVQVVNLLYHWYLQASPIPIPIM